MYENDQTCVCESKRSRLSCGGCRDHPPP
ncbi:periplasmic nitrate reductase, large subunit, partial [Vibrio cholerae BJG-01]